MFGYNVAGRLMPVLEVAGKPDLVSELREKLPKDEYTLDRKSHDTAC